MSAGNVGLKEKVDLLIRRLCVTLTMNTYSKTLKAAGFAPQELLVPEKGAPVAVGPKQRTITQDALRAAIRRENAAKALMAH